MFKKILFIGVISILPYIYCNAQKINIISEEWSTWEIIDTWKDNGKQVDSGTDSTVITFDKGNKLVTIEMSGKELRSFEVKQIDHEFGVWSLKSDIYKSVWIKENAIYFEAKKGELALIFTKLTWPK